MSGVPNLRRDMPRRTGAVLSVDADAQDGPRTRRHGRVLRMHGLDRNGRTPGAAERPSCARQKGYTAALDLIVPRRRHQGRSA